MSAPNRLHELVDGVFTWFEQNLEWFDPFKDSSNPHIFSTSKPLLELACICMYYERCVLTNRDPRVRKFISFIHDVWQHPQYRERLVRSPEMIRLYGMTCIALRCCGAGDSSDYELIQRVIDQGYVGSIEDVPFRVLDFRNMLDCGGFRHNLPSYATLYKQTLLASTPPVMYLTDNDAYSITHTLFYLSDFGSRPLGTILKEELPQIRWMVGMLMGIYLRLKNWDLVAEFLICCRCLHWSPPCIFDAAWEALLDAQLPDGSVPGPLFSKRKLSEIDDESKRKDYCLGQNYHTTLVSALAGFATAEWTVASTFSVPNN
jgi:hypothetical protein